MSDITSLSSDYSVTAEFAKEFNRAVLVLKRLHLAHESLPSPTADDVAQARMKLAEHVRGIIGQLAPEAGATPAAERIPEAVISRLAEKNQNKMTWLVADLRQVQRALNEETPLGERDFGALDAVCDAADA